MQMIHEKLTQNSSFYFRHVKTQKKNTYKSLWLIVNGISKKITLNKYSHVYMDRKNFDIWHNPNGFCRWLDTPVKLGKVQKILGLYCNFYNIIKTDSVRHIIIQISSIRMKFKYLLFTSMRKKRLILWGFQTLFYNWWDSIKIRLKKFFKVAFFL